MLVLRRHDDARLRGLGCWGHGVSRACLGLGWNLEGLSQMAMWLATKSIGKLNLRIVEFLLLTLIYRDVDHNKTQALAATVNYQ